MTADTLQDWATLKQSVTLIALVVLWSWESWAPYIADRPRRWRHAVRNVLVALLNTLVLGVVFAGATVGIANGAEERAWGALHLLGWSGPTRWLLALALLDGWLYLWHRANHRFPLLWRFHRMHHSDAAMDVTSATRFHLGEQILSATLRLALIPLLGVTALEIVVFETCVVALTMFHHANISIGRLDRLLRVLIVTPRMHQVHHSRFQPETNSNYAVIFSGWDRLAGTYRRRVDDQPISLGLTGFDDDRWQTVLGMLRTPLVQAENGTPPERKP